MQRRSGLLCAVLMLGAAIPAGAALAQYSPGSAPIYRDNLPPPNSRDVQPQTNRGLPPSWMVDDEEDGQIPPPGYGRRLNQGPGYVPQGGPVGQGAQPPQGYYPSTAQPGPAPNPQPNFARTPAEPDVVRPPGEVGAQPPGGLVPQRPPVAASSLPPEEQPEVGEPKTIDPRFKKQLVDYSGSEPAGTVIIDTSHKFLFLTLGGGKAIRYGIGVGREGFTWAGAERVSKMAEWPDWHPPSEMIERQPYLPRFMAGGDGNPLGARALYLGKTLYRIHGTNQPSTIGTNVSSGCIRLINTDIEDLYSRVQVGTRVVVLPAAQPSGAFSATTQPAGPQGPGAPMHLGANGPTGSVNAPPLPAAR